MVLKLCKGSPINSASIETLLEKDFQPARTIVLASGFDEEIGGRQVSNATFFRPGVRA
jgi:acetylornithine deacetylase/succinyl-diaminopimelate desuccinylase-like protein